MLGRSFLIREPELLKVRRDLLLSIHSNQLLDLLTRRKVAVCSSGCFLDPSAHKECRGIVEVDVACVSVHGVAPATFVGVDVAFNGAVPLTETRMLFGEVTRTKLLWHVDIVGEAQGRSLACAAADTQKDEGEKTAHQGT